MKELVRSLLVFVIMSVVTGFLYPFLVTGIAGLEFGRQARGSLVERSGKVVGSSLVGQQFKAPRYIHGRPSATEKPYDAASSGASNAAPSNARFLAEVASRAEAVRKEEGLQPGASVPPDMVLASGSGLDPHISREGALIQAARVARERRLPEGEVKNLIHRWAESPRLGFMGSDRVNVLAVNLALDEMSRRKDQAATAR